MRVCRVFVPDTLTARLLNVKVNKGLILRHGLDPGGEPELAGGDHYVKEQRVLTWRRGAFKRNSSEKQRFTFG